MDSTTASLSARARRASSRWPSCNAPIVGTSPTDADPRSGASAARRSATVRTILIGARTPGGRAIGAAPRSARPEGIAGRTARAPSPDRGWTGAGPDPSIPVERVNRTWTGVRTPTWPRSPDPVGQAFGGGDQRVQQLDQLRHPIDDGGPMPGDRARVASGHRTGQRGRTEPAPVLQRRPG